MQRPTNRLFPFIMLGVGLVAFAFGIIILAYLFFFGAILGLILFIVNWIRAKYFPSKYPVQQKQGRTFDADDFRN